jgi:hypothetical protein
MGFADSISGPLENLGLMDWVFQRQTAQGRQGTDYSHWFTNDAVFGRLHSLATRYKALHSDYEREQTMDETRAAIVFYSLLIYHLYPSIPDFKKKVDTTPEMRSNFSTLKEWFDGNGGGKIAEDFYGEIAAEINGNGRRS